MTINNTVYGNIIDIVESQDNDINIGVQGCNCFNVMGSGLAGQLVNKYPDILKVDKEFGRIGDPDKLGKFSRFDVYDEQTKLFASQKRLTWFNAYTQYHHNASLNPINYEAVGRVFMAINSLLPHGSKVAIPQIGAGLAGGDWPTIGYIIDKVTPNLQITLVKFKQ